VKPFDAARDIMSTAERARFVPARHARNYT
jgi:hypothetical protein